MRNKRYLIDFFSSSTQVQSTGNCNSAQKQLKKLSWPKTSNQKVMKFGMVISYILVCSIRYSFSKEYSEGISEKYQVRENKNTYNWAIPRVSTGLGKKNESHGLMG